MNINKDDELYDKLSDFVNKLQYAEKKEYEIPKAGEKIWKFIKGEILRKKGNLSISKNGLTGEEKKSALELCATMEEVTALVKDGIDISDNCSLLQEAAIALGERIEGIIGEGSDTVRLLEEICEEIFLFSESNDKSHLERIGKLISLVKKSVNRLSDKLNILFLPYKYSMWDALESVWRAAYADEEAVVTVAPIPYVERDSDGAAGEAKYELDLFLRHVPVKICTEIDIEAMHPDAIFIHNPYDGVNTVTSVFPDYYCMELKDYTEELCYIPYNLFGYDHVYEHHAHTPGILFSNHVFLQSEKVREQFIEHFDKYLRESKLYDMTLGIEKKFVNLGSPKTDRLFFEANKEHELPKEWVEKIGTGKNRKKILFINTHLAIGTPSYVDYYSPKVEELLSLFEKITDAVAIWRPHPLTIQTINAMNPDFLPKYQAYVDRAKACSNIIFDENEDTFMGLTIADGFYGDYASLGQFFSYLERPILTY